MSGGSRGVLARRVARVALGVVVAVTPGAAAAQRAASVPGIGYLANEPTPDSIPVLRERLRKHGWDEGRSVKIWYRYAQGKLDLYPRHAEELARLDVAVIVAVGAPAIDAARHATKTIPIVMVALDDPVVTGLVTEPPSPGVNLTGLTTFAAGLSTRRLEMLKQAVPGLERAVALWNPASASVAKDLREAQSAARARGVELVGVEIGADRDVRDTFTAVLAERPQGLVVLADAVTLAHRERIVTFASRNRLPAVFPLRDFADAGGLLSYGASWTDVYQVAAGFVDRILKGAKPSQLPVARATRFELVINLRTARKLDLRVPANLLERADRLIE